MQRSCMVQWIVSMVDVVETARMLLWVSGCLRFGQLRIPPRCHPACWYLIYACFWHSPSTLMAWGSLPHPMWWLLLLYGSMFLSLPFSSTLEKPKWGPLLCSGRLRKEMEELIVCFCLPTLVAARVTEGELDLWWQIQVVTGTGIPSFSILTLAPTRRPSCCSLHSFHGMSVVDIGAVLLKETCCRPSCFLEEGIERR